MPAQRYAVVTCSTTPKVLELFDGESECKSVICEVSVAFNVTVASVVDWLELASTAQY